MPNMRARRVEKFRNEVENLSSPWIKGVERLPAA